MRDYNRFFNAILENPLLRSSEIVEEFLTKNVNDFHIIKLKYKRIQKITQMSDFHSLTGELDTTYYQENLKLLLNINKEISAKNTLFNNLNVALKEVTTQLDILNTKMKNLSNIFFDINNEYNKTKGDFKIFESLGNFSKILSDIYTKQKTMLEINIKEFFKYMNLELEEINKLHTNYIYAKKSSENYDIEIEKYSKENKMAGDEEYYLFALKRKQAEVSTAKRVCNFLQNCFCDEYKRIMETHSQRIKRQFSENKANNIGIFQKEYDNLIQLINSF